MNRKTISKKGVLKNKTRKVLEKAPTTTSIDWPTLLEKVYKKCKGITSGHNADYIPILKKVDPHLYAISVFTVDGKAYNIGDVDVETAIESVSKVFSLALALKKNGIPAVLKKIGNEQSHDIFNSVKAIEKSKIHTQNSFNNGGAMATTSLYYVPNRRSFQKRIYDTMSAFAGRRLKMSKPIYESEYKNSDHNRGIAYLLESYDRFYGNVESTVDVYTRQCSALVNSQDIAIMASVLANGGVHPKTGKRLLDSKQLDYICTHMIKNGLYEMSDKWLKHVGYPTKSGVGGFILMVIPGVAGIGILSPPLDTHGNSFKGHKTAEELVKLL